MAMVRLLPPTVAYFLKTMASFDLWLINRPPTSHLVSVGAEEEY
jgi:hypothetical protein